jgi:hypothetical protein
VPARLRVSPRPVDIQSRFAADMAEALAEEYRTTKLVVATDQSLP